MSVLLEVFMQRLRSIISGHSLENEEVSVFARPLSPEEAIGNPIHDDYPLLRGKERMMQATFQNTYGQAYSDQTGNFSGSLSQIIGLPMDSNLHRALLVATANAVLRKLGVITKSCHCRDEDPMTCASYLRDSVLSYAPRRIGMIGMQPRLLESLARDFEVRVCDRDPDKIGMVQAGVLVEDSEAHREIKGWADLLFATGTTLVNDTIDLYVGEVPVVFYGVTISGAARLLNLNHFCPLGR